MTPDPKDSKKLNTIKDSLNNQLLWQLVYAAAGEEEEEPDGGIQRNPEQRKSSNGNT